MENQIFLEEEEEQGKEEEGGGEEGGEEEEEGEEELDLLQSFQKKLTIIPELEDIIIGLSIQFWKKDDNNNIKFDCDIDERHITSNIIKLVLQENRPVKINISMTQSKDRKILKSGIIIVYLFLYLDVSRTISCGILAESYNFSNLELPRKNMDEIMSEINSSKKRVYWSIHTDDDNNNSNKIIKMEKESLRITKTNEKDSIMHNDNNNNNNGSSIKWGNTIARDNISLEISYKSWIVTKSDDTCCIENIYIELHLENESFSKFLKTCIENDYSQNTI